MKKIKEQRRYCILEARGPGRHARSDLPEALHLRLEQRRGGLGASHLGQGLGQLYLVLIHLGLCRCSPALRSFFSA